jgi:hypothetical protein
VSYQGIDPVESPGSRPNVVQRVAAGLMGGAGLHWSRSIGSQYVTLSAFRSNSVSAAINLLLAWPTTRSNGGAKFRLQYNWIHSIILGSSTLRSLACSSLSPSSVMLSNKIRPRVSRRGVARVTSISNVGSRFPFGNGSFRLNLSLGPLIAHCSGHSVGYGIPIYLS